MPWIIGASSGLAWADLRAKVRGDLWRPGTAGIPDDVVDRELHASILEIEAERHWLWLENIRSDLRLDEPAADFEMPTSAGVIHSLAVVYDNGRQDRLDLLPLQLIRESAASAQGVPSAYAVSDRRIYLDTVAPTTLSFEMIFDAQCPDLLADAVQTPPITASLHQEAVLAGAKAYCATEYLHDDAKFARNRAQFDRHLGRMSDRDDQRRSDLHGGTIQPNTALFDAAHGFRG